MDNQNNINKDEITEEISKEPNLPTKNNNQGVSRAILDYAEMFVWAVLAVLIVFTFAFRLCRVQGSSMLETLKNNEMVITTNIFYTPKQDDIIVFHQTSTENPNLNEPIIKRVIATEGQTVKIDFNDANNMKIWVDGVEYDDASAFLDPMRSHIYPQYNFNYTTGIFEATVPEGHVFVLGDNRDNSNDSRSLSIGFVNENRILGKALFRIKPFTWLD